MPHHCGTIENHQSEIVNLKVGPAGFEPATKECQVFIFLGYDSGVLELLILYHQITSNVTVRTKQ
jgi:hypothetical protein